MSSDGFVEDGFVEDTVSPVSEIPLNGGMSIQPHNTEGLAASLGGEEVQPFEPAPIEAVPHTPAGPDINFDTFYRTKGGLRIRFTNPLTEKPSVPGGIPDQVTLSEFGGPNPEWKSGSPLGAVKSILKTGSEVVEGAVKPMLERVQSSNRFQKGASLTALVGGEQAAGAVKKLGAAIPVFGMGDETNAQYQRQNGAAAEYLFRAAGQLLYGRSFFTDMDENDLADATSALERAATSPLLQKFFPGAAQQLATVGAAGAGAVAEQVGYAPMMMVGFGSGRAVAVKATALAGKVPLLNLAPRLLGGAAGAAAGGAEGNVVNAVMTGGTQPLGSAQLDESGAVQPDAPVDLWHAAKMGAALGVGFHGAAMVPSTVMLTKGVVQDFAKEMFAAGERGEQMFLASAPHVERVRQQGAQLEWAKASAARDEVLSPTGQAFAANVAEQGGVAKGAVNLKPRMNIDPNAVIVGVDDEGKVIAQLWEVTNNEQAVHRVELTNKRIAQWVSARARVNGVRPIASYEAMQRLEQDGLKGHIFPPLKPDDTGQLGFGLDKEKMKQQVYRSAETKPLGPTPRQKVIVESNARQADEFGVQYDAQGNMLHLHGDGTWTINRLETAEERAAALRVHRLSEVTVDGEVQRGYLMQHGGEAWLMPPHPDEGIPGAVLDGLDVTYLSPQRVGGAELLDIANQVPPSLDVYQRARHDPRIVDSASLLDAMGQLVRMNRGTELTVQTVAEALGIKKVEAAVVLKFYMGKFGDHEQGGRALETVVKRMLSRVPGDDGVGHVAPFLKAPPSPQFPGPAAIAEHTPGAMMSMPPEAVEQTTARLQRQMIEGSLSEHYGIPDNTPPYVIMKDGSQGQIIAHESEGFIVVQTPVETYRATLDDVAQVLGDVQSVDPLTYTNLSEVRTALAAAHDSTSGAERGRLMSQVFEQARRDGFSESELAGAMDDAANLPRNAAGEPYLPEHPDVPDNGPSSNAPPPGGAGGGGNGGLPPSGPPDPPSSLPPEAPKKSPPPESIPPHDALMASFLARMQKQIGANPIFSKDRYIAEASIQMQSLKQLQQGEEVRVNRLFKRAFGDKVLTPDFRNDFNNYALGKSSLSDFMAKHPEVRDHRQQLVEEVTKKRTQLEMDIRKLGGLPEHERADIDEYADYLTRSHYRFMLPAGEWAKIVKADGAKFNQAVEFFAKRVKDSEVLNWEGRTVSELAEQKQAIARRQVLEIIGDNDMNDPLSVVSERPAGAQGFLNSLKGRSLDAEFHRLKGEALKLLEQNQTVPQELLAQIVDEEARVKMLRGLLGETTDGVTSIAITLGRQQSIKRQLEVMRDVSRVPELATDDATKRTPDGRDFVKIPPQQRSQWGLLAGKYVHPDAIEGLKWAVNTPQVANTIWRRLAGHVKGMMVLPGLGGFAPILHQMMDNVVTGIMTGGLDITRDPIGAGKALGKALAVVNEGSRGKAVDNELIDLWQRATSVGMNPPNFGEMEIAQRNNTLLRQITKKGSSDFWEIRDALSHPGRTLKSLTVAPAAKVFDFPDRMTKLGSWLGNRERILADPMRYLGSRYTPQMDRGVLERHADLLAARWVAERMPNFDRVSRIQDQIRNNGPVGVVAPFSTFMTEDLRRFATLPGHVARSAQATISGKVDGGQDPDLWARVVRLGLVGMTLGQMFKSQRQANGISDADVSEAYGNLSDQVQQNVGPGLIADMKRDENGAIVFHDYSSFFGMLKYLNGRADSPWYARIPYNLLKLPVSGGLGDTMVDNILGEPLKLVDAQWKGKAAPWQDEGAGAIDTLLKVPVFPQGLIRIATPLQQGGILGQPTLMGKQLTKGQAVESALGWVAHPSGDREKGIAAQRHEWEYKEALRTAKRAGKPQAGGFVTNTIEALGGQTLQDRNIENAVKRVDAVVQRRFGGVVPEMKKKGKKP